MQLFFYDKCATQTKRAMRCRDRKSNYVPRDELILRMVQETGWSYRQVRDQMIAESKYLRAADEIEL